jgi:hypothetical protein
MSEKMQPKTPSSEQALDAANACVEAVRAENVYHCVYTAETGRQDSVLVSSNIAFLEKWTLSKKYRFSIVGRTPARRPKVLTT